jgi:hypothetical protein
MLVHFTVHIILIYFAGAFLEYRGPNLISNNILWRWFSLTHDLMAVAVNGSHVLKSCPKLAIVWGDKFESDQ